jgi:hypothetical protein
MGAHGSPFAVLSLLSPFSGPFALFPFATATENARIVRVNSLQPLHRLRGDQYILYQLSYWTGELVRCRIRPVYIGFYECKDFRNPGVIIICVACFSPFWCPFSGSTGTGISKRTTMIHNSRLEMLIVLIQVLRPLCWRLF